MARRRRAGDSIPNPLRNELIDIPHGHLQSQHVNSVFEIQLHTMYSQPEC